MVKSFRNQWSVILHYLRSFHLLPRLIFLIVSFSLHLYILISPRIFLFIKRLLILYFKFLLLAPAPKSPYLGDCSLCSGKRRGVTLRCWGFRNRDIGVEAWGNTKKYKLHVYVMPGCLSNIIMKVIKSEHRCWLNRPHSVIELPCPCDTCLSVWMTVCVIGFSFQSIGPLGRCFL